MTSRDAILARLRAAPHPVPAHPAPWRPAPTDDPAAQFIERLGTVFGTAERLTAQAEIPAAAARYLAAHGLPLTAAIAAEFAPLGWAEAGLTPLPPPAKASVPAAVSRAAAASAETGTLLLASTDPDGPWANLLADTHIAILAAGAISGAFEDAVARRTGNRLPRSLHAVTGPSRTGDIEQTLELGAHGAVRLHVLIVP